MKTKTQNHMKLTFAAQSQNESFARAAVSAFAATLDPTVEELVDLRTAVSEAVTNCIVHAYRERPSGEVRITCRADADRKLTVTIKDKGCGIEDIKKAREPLYTTDPGGERSGLGFTVMESFCDKVAVRSKAGVGTTVTLTKKFSSAEAPLTVRGGR